jgi:glycosyltransferase involved in cell wall biosynthesis
MKHRASKSAKASMSNRGRLCFYVPYLYPVASGGEIRTIGGSEVRHWSLARALAAQDFDVVVATCDYGQSAVVTREGVTLLRTYSTAAGVPGLRFFYPRLWKAMSTLWRARADVYLASGSGIAAGWAYDAARLRRSRFVFLAASDGDALPSLPWLTNRREKWWYRRALRGADARVAQTEPQGRLFRDNFGVETHVIPNPVEIPAVPADAGGNDVVLWLSTYKSSKRPEWFLELARRLPQFQFVMIGFPPDAEATESWLVAKRAAAQSTNLQVHGFVEHSRIGEFLANAALFVHTSPLEGFPMTLLEAWSYGIPAVTSFDPGGVIERHGLGMVVDNVEELVEAVATTMAAPDLRRVLGKRAREYVEGHHGPDRTYEPMAALLDRMIASGTR